MANHEHVALLKQGAATWKAWREENANIRPDLRKASLSGANLSGTDLRKANLVKANLGGAHLREADLRDANLIGANLRKSDLHGADLREANLGGAHLREADLRDANLVGANLRKSDLHGADLRAANLIGASWAHLREADLREVRAKANLAGKEQWRKFIELAYGAELRGTTLREADLSQANLSGTDLRKADLSRTNLIGADLRKADLTWANLSGADLSGANLSRSGLYMADLTLANLSGADLSGSDLGAAILLNTDLTGADLTGCRIYGVSAWGLKLERAKQQNLVITPVNEFSITVDNIEVAQFIYLLLHNEKVRDIIDTVGKKGVLLLGRFTEGRIEVLERLREKLRDLGFVPMVFNFDKPETKDFTETVRLLASLSKFVIVDLTTPRSAPLELQATVPQCMVPFAPIIQQPQEPFSMFVDLQNAHDWVLRPVIGYPSVERLIEVLEDKIVRPAEAKFDELLARRTKQLRVENI
jgi:uncharacterized protein YjbI with pentapeptide repeats